MRDFVKINCKDLSIKEVIEQLKELRERYGNGRYCKVIYWNDSLILDSLNNLYNTFLNFSEEELKTKGYRANMNASL
jgi:hypothetical protein